MWRKAFVLLFFGGFLLGMPGGSVSAQTADATQPPLGSASMAASAGRGALAPGGAAGIRQAQAQPRPIWNFVPFGIVGGLAALVVLLNDDDDGGTTVTTTGTN
jgi:hypothetical protein